MLSSLKSLFLFGSKASVIAALTYLSIVVSKKVFLPNSSNDTTTTAVGAALFEQEIEQEYKELVTRIDKIMVNVSSTSNLEMRTQLLDSITNFLNKYVKMLHADQKLQQSVASNPSSDATTTTTSASTTSRLRPQIIILKYLKLLIVGQCYEKLLKKYPADMLESGMLLPLSSYISYHLSVITTANINANSTTNTAAVATGGDSEDSLPTACELLNELFFQITVPKLKSNKRIEKSILAVINIIPWMFQVGSNQAMFRQTCCNIMSFLSLNNKLLSDEIWDKLAIKCMESDVVETLTDTMYRICDRTDATSETCMRSCIVTLAFLLDGRPELISRFQNHLQESLDKEQQAQLYRAWAKHSVEAHELIKVFAVKLLHLSQRQ